LHGERHVADFVEEDRPSLSLFELAEMACASAGDDPFSCPNNSDSISSAGTAAQLSVTKGPLNRGLRSCNVRATSSLPVPVSPECKRAFRCGYFST